MKLIVRADDFGIADSVTWGALRGFQEGIVTSSGVMTNMPSSEVACQQAKIHPEFCFGQDINIATGKCVAPKEKLPTMVNEEGYFRRSGIIREMIKKGEEPFPYDEVYLEVVAQVEKFISLVGRKPAYLNGHAFRSPNFSKALKDVADQYGLICMDEIVEKYDLENCGFKSSGKFAQGWYQLPFKNDTQLATDSEQFFIDHFDELLVRDVSYIICHPGYVSMDLMECSTLNLVRMKDLQMCISPKVRELIESHHVELISIKEFVEEYDK
ncbi:MAG: ChbG/HpnK family deacetylase [Erysipelotrichaceae bacterium]|nr:ChbG/HpnK family deacetylase [Erysipelotrichaceae bacterium]